MEITQRHKTDVLIIGAGAAGLRAALAAAEAGSSVVITNKGPVGKIRYYPNGCRRYAGAVSSQRQCATVF